MKKLLIVLLCGLTLFSGVMFAGCNDYEPVIDPPPSIEAPDKDETPDPTTPSNPSDGDDPSDSDDDEDDNPGPEIPTITFDKDLKDKLIEAINTEFENNLGEGNGIKFDFDINGATCTIIIDFTDAIDLVDDMDSAMDEVKIALETVLADFTNITSDTPVFDDSDEFKVLITFNKKAE